MFDIVEASDGKYYIYDTVSDSYLHCDGELREMATHEGEHTGWYSSKRAAQTTLNKWKKKNPAKTHFPVLIRESKTGKEYFVHTPEDLPQRILFSILKCNVGEKTHD